MALTSALALLCYPCQLRADATSTLTLDNQSGEIALVKLVGPTRRAVEVPRGTSRTVNLSAGSYYLLVRYGAQQGSYRYSKGQRFDVEERLTATSREFSRITITLHKVVGGNYSTAPSSREEFDGQVLLDELAPPSIVIDLNDCKDRFAHFATLIFIGKPGTEADLMNELGKDGFSEDIALLFLCSGNTILAKQARAWLATTKPTESFTCSDIGISSYHCAQGYTHYPLWGAWRTFGR